MGLKNVTTSNGKGIASNGTTAVDIYTAPSGTKDPGGNTSPGYGAWCHAVRLFNSDTILHDVQIHNIPNGQSLGNDTMCERVSLPAGQVIRVLLDKEWLGPQDKLQIKLGEAISSTQVYARPQATEST